MGSKPPVAVGVRILKSERHDFGAAAPLSTKTSSLRGRVGGSAFTPKVVELFGPDRTLFAEQLSPCFASTAAAAPSVRSRVFLSAGTSASMARRDCRASCSRLAKRCSILLKSSLNSLKALPIDSDNTRRKFSYVIITYASWGVGSLTAGTALLFFGSILG